MFLQKRRTASKGRCLSGGAFTMTTLSIQSVFAYLLCVLFLPVGNVSSSRQPSKELAANARAAQEAAEAKTIDLATRLAALEARVSLLETPDVIAPDGL